MTTATYTSAQARDLEIHPLALIFPAMSDTEFVRLRASIRERGLIEPITVWNAHGVIDGRHRLAACIEENREALVNILNFDDESAARAYVLARNIERRHMNESQRAIMAARITTRGAGRRARDDHTVRRDEAARMFGVSISTVSIAQKVLTDDDQTLWERVWAGEMSLSTAIRAIRRRTLHARPARAPSIDPMPAYIEQPPDVRVETHASDLAAIVLSMSGDATAWTRSMIDERGHEATARLLFAVEEFVRSAISIVDEEFPGSREQTQAPQTIGDERDAQRAEGVDVVANSAGRARSRVRRTRTARTRAASSADATDSESESAPVITGRGLDVRSLWPRGWAGALRGSDVVEYRVEPYARTVESASGIGGGIERQLESRGYRLHVRFADQESARANMRPTDQMSMNGDGSVDMVRDIVMGAGAIVDLSERYPLRIVYPDMQHARACSEPGDQLFERRDGSVESLGFHGTAQQRLGRLQMMLARSWELFIDELATQSEVPQYFAEGRRAAARARAEAERAEAERAEAQRNVDQMNEAIQERVQRELDQRDDDAIF